MTSEMTARDGRGIILMIGLVGVFLLSLGACVGDPSKPAPTVTQERVRSHADQTFEKLKQEELDRAGELAVTP